VNGTGGYSYSPPSRRNVSPMWRNGGERALGTFSIPLKNLEIKKGQL